MNRYFYGCGLAAFGLAVGSVFAGEASDKDISTGIHFPGTSWLDDANDWSLFDGKITASLYGSAIYGGASGEVGELYPAGHDPKREGWTIQGIEPGISLRPTEHLEGFASGVFFTDENGDWDSELEEAFAVLRDLPGGFELRVGQLLNRVGLQNATHLHSWDQVDYPLVLSRFLGEDGLITRSGEINWLVPLGDPLTTATQVTFSYGEVRPHDGHGGEEHHGEGEVEFEGEGAEFDDNVFTARLIRRHRINDFHELSYGGSFVYGDNAFGRHNQIGGIDVEYVWRENGLESGGRAFRWRAELYGRGVAAVSGELHEDAHVEEADHHEEEIRRRRFKEFGAYTSATYTWNAHWDTGLRLGYVSGIADLGLDERFRVSPNITYYPDAARRFHLRGQYNYDHIDQGGAEHAVWLQLGFSFGAGNEVR